MINFIKSPKFLFSCRIGWHQWAWWEFAGVAINGLYGPGHPQYKKPFTVQRQTCVNCGKTRQRFVGPAVSNSAAIEKAEVK